MMAAEVFCALGQFVVFVVCFTCLSPKWCKV